MYTVCVNLMGVDGPKKEIRKFVKKLCARPAQYLPYFTPTGEVRHTPKGPKYFCFNSILPVPKYVLVLGELSEKQVVFAEHPLFKRISSGADWQFYNWGVDTDVWDQKITPEKMGYTNGCTHLSFTFETHERPPVRWLEHLFRLLPKLKFYLAYEIRGQFAHGDIYGENGELWDTGVLVEPAEEVFGTEEDVADIDCDMEEDEYADSDKEDLPF